jgi:two-component system response regulator TctD
MSRILIVEDDRALARGLAALLRAQGHAVDAIESGKLALRLASEESYAVIILDLGLPDLSGFDVLRGLRRGGLSTPVLVLTARDSIEDRVRGLDEGGDDYLLKPFEPSELLARVRALVRRGGSELGPSFSVGNLVCYPGSCNVEVAGRQIELRRREWAVLYGLASRAGKVVPKERLANEVFGFDDPVGPNALEVYVARLRKKLQPEGPAIRNLRGLGYIMDGEVR